MLFCRNFTDSICSVKLPYNHHTEILQNEILDDPTSCYKYYALIENNKSQLEEVVILPCDMSYSKTKLALS